MIFNKAAPEKRKGFPLNAIFDGKDIAGDIGIEVECEGNKFQKHNENLAPFWCYHQDNSLRGNDNAEYVLRKPIKFEQVPTAIDSLWKVFESYGTKLDVSNRTSVHVHLNCQKFHLNRLTSFLAFYFTVEEILTEWCGEHRVGNLFCLRAKDAPAIVNQLRKFIANDGNYKLPDNFHYAGLNAHSLFVHGSLEIRTLRGVTNPETILDWVSILQRLYLLSNDYKDPRDIPGLFSAEGPAQFFESVLGPHAFSIRQQLSWTNERIIQSLYEGIRIAQDLCYAQDWSMFEEGKIKKDPFGRKDTVIMKKLLGNNGGKKMKIPSIASLGGNAWATHPLPEQAPQSTPYATVPQASWLSPHIPADPIAEAHADSVEEFLNNHFNQDPQPTDFEDEDEE